nr:immunoglobulin heavy chain junction region [Mus musculus]MBK4185467.1 immunoglobulin heavy chain junction region [Mus musculus]MBK4185468.1 immunoglobulin heavy chain junction region [Mus musculus]MBK4185470.1 immunoglobulin heavy chain junction region [Mus musculus]MBK4185471.1 immunoglobulin heavy chain junction region [Mus musculus]
CARSPIYDGYYLDYW